MAWRVEGLSFSRVRASLAKRAARTTRRGASLRARGAALGWQSQDAGTSEIDAVMKETRCGQRETGAPSWYTRPMPLRLPALDPQTLLARSTTGYPEPFRSRVLPREKRALGDATGLTKIGVNLTTLPPGKESSMRHTHTHEDEFVYVLEGEVVLVTDAGEQLLGPGACAGFPAGSKDGHHLVNRGDRPARYLEISNRDDADRPLYSDVDLALLPGPDGVLAFMRKDGTPY